MNKITAEAKSKILWTISLEKKIVGEIKFLIEGNSGFYQYFAKDKKVGGEKFPTYTACFRSLQDEE